MCRGADTTFNQTSEWNATSVPPNHQPALEFSAKTQLNPTLEWHSITIRNTECLYFAGSVSIEKKKKKHVVQPERFVCYSWWLQRQQICLVVLYSQVAVMAQKPPFPPKLNSGFFRVSCSAVFLTGSKYICVKITGSAFRLDLHWNWSPKGS